MRLQHPTVRWQYCSAALLLLSCYLLFAMHALQARIGGTDASELRVAAITPEDGGRSQQQITVDDRIRALEQQLKSALERANRTQQQQQPAPPIAAPTPWPTAATGNPLHLPPYLSPTCSDPDVILFQRYAQQRQHAYMETREQRESGSALNPDPDPYCLNTRLFIDTQASTYLWSDDDLRQEMKEVAAADAQQSMSELEAAADAAQRSQPDPIPPRPGRRIMRESGFGVAAQLHIIAARMLWAWQHGYTYVNIARTTWAKGVPFQPAPAFPPTPEAHSDRAWVPHAAPIPFRGDASYMSGKAGGRTAASAPTLESDACKDGGWDCFFLPWTSPACISRARALHAEFANYPPLTDLNRATIARLERQYGVRHNADLSEFLKRKSFSTSQAIKDFNRRWIDEGNGGNRRDTAAALADLTQLPTLFDFSGAAVDDPEDGLAGADPPSNSASSAASASTIAPGNPWNLPGLAFDRWGSTAHGDLFLHSEMLRFLVRPNPYMQRKLRALLQEMQFPGVRREPLQAATGLAAAAVEADEPDRESSASMVLSLHVRRNVDAPRATSRFVPVHRSFEYLLHASRLVQNLGLGSVFLSTDDRSKLDLFLHSLAEGSVKDPGLGMHAMHVPHRLLGEGASIASREAQAPGTRQISARAAAALAAQALLDEEGAMHVASLLIMGAFSRAFVGTLSSHWGRMVLEMSRWGSCAPPKQGWLMPDSSSSHWPASSSTALSSPAIREFDFVDLDGDSYFVGDFRNIKHPRVAPYNAQDLDPSKP